MKTYSIPIIWESFKRYDVEAENLQDAVTKALSQFLKEPDDNYIDDSFSIDEFVLEEHPEESFSIDTTIQNLKIKYNEQESNNI
jgi:methionine synthase II (cobalamin-independent)